MVIIRREQGEGANPSAVENTVVSNGAAEPVNAPRRFHQGRHPPKTRQESQTHPNPQVHQLEKLHTTKGAQQGKTPHNR
ncbi:hypothetical protein, partial [Nocardia cyriacigeorgica]|uniref:hypothetical protein n=1 Tax=Nocardia cyriacigeorgica TaxID=135487 RepID=UPI002453D425